MDECFLSQSSTNTRVDVNKNKVVDRTDKKWDKSTNIIYLFKAGGI